MELLDGEEGDDDYFPTLFDNEDDAFAEIFDDSLSMLQSHEQSEQLEDLNDGITPEMIREMEPINSSKDVNAMRAFMDKYPDCNDYESWVEPAETFIMNRRAIWTEIGLVITGTKLAV